MSRYGLIEETGRVEAEHELLRAARQGHGGQGAEKMLKVSRYGEREKARDERRS